MLVIDLTPPAYRKKHLRSFIALTGERILALLTLLVLLVGVLFIVTDWYIQQQLQTEADRLLALPRAITSPQSELDTTLSLLSDAAIIQQAWTPTAPILLPLVSATPPGIQLISLTYAKPTNTVQIQGVATQRDGIINFAKNLEAVPAIATVNVPIETLTKQTDIPFTIMITLKSAAEL